MSRRAATAGVLLAVSIGLAGRIAAAPPPPPLSERQQRWLALEGAAVASDLERELFLGLQGSVTRDQFIAAFWAAREEAAKAHGGAESTPQARMAEAERLFGRSRSRPPELDERARFFLQLGPPWERETFPAGATSPALERWTCRGDPALGLPSWFHLVFYQPAEGELFRRYRPLVDGPEKLVRGGPGAEGASPERVLAGLGAELAAAVRAPVVVPTGPESTRELEDALADLPNRLPADLSYLNRFLSASSTPPLLSGLGYTFGSVGPEGSLLHYAVELQPGAYALEPVEGGGRRARLRVRLQLSASDRFLPPVVAPVEVRLSESEYATVGRNPFAFEDVLPLVPGRYQARLTVEDQGRPGVVLIDTPVEIPGVSEKVGLGPLLLVARGAEGAGEERRPFSIGGSVWYPLARATMPSRQDLHAIVQVIYPPGAAPASELTLRYRVLRGEDEAVAGFDTITIDPKVDRGFAAVVVEARVRELEPGEYRLVVSIGAGPRELGSSATAFRIEAAPPPLPAWAYMYRRESSAARDGLLLARQYLALGRAAEARGQLERLADVPDLGGEARLLLADLLLASGEPKAAQAAIEPLARAEGASVVMLAGLAEARRALGDAQGAVRAWEVALLRAPRSTRVLNGLAALELGLGGSERATEHYRRSLAIDPEQPEIARRFGSPSPAPGR